MNKSEKTQLKAVAEDLQEIKGKFDALGTLLIQSGRINWEYFMHTTGVAFMLGGISLALGSKFVLPGIVIAFLGLVGISLSIGHMWGRTLRDIRDLRTKGKVKS
ncbi:MAG: hypothetical protein FJ006_03910 [Chloroflexi bacterium]|nr:hypothetical protein [Chloroflexota bacterium]